MPGYVSVVLLGRSELIATHCSMQVQACYIEVSQRRGRQKGEKERRKRREVRGAIPYECLLHIQEKNPEVSLPQEQKGLAVRRWYSTKSPCPVWEVKADGEGVLSDCSEY